MGNKVVVDYNLLLRCVFLHNKKYVETIDKSNDVKIQKIRLVFMWVLLRPTSASYIEIRIGECFLFHSLVCIYVAHKNHSGQDFSRVRKVFCVCFLPIKVKAGTVFTLRWLYDY